MQRRRMNLMASVSRSSGLEKDGDDLKSYRTQVEYRAFIQEKVDHLFKTYSHTASETERAKKHRFDAQENILILFRKSPISSSRLREGVASSKRNDDFALEVYQTSLYLSALFEAPKQTISIIPHLFPPQHEPSDSHTKLPRPPSMSCVLISLLHHLVTSYPSQSQYFQQLDAIPKDQLPGTSEAAVWLKSLAKSVRTRNYAAFVDLSNKSSLLAVLLPEKDKVPASQDTATSWKIDPDQGLKAVLLLTETLRKKVADTTWNVIRASYRELNQNTLKTTSWLSRSLCLESIYDSSFNITTENWLVTKSAAPEGHVRRKEGVEGRWIVCKVR
ncbi:hypothetical protein CPC08DRAFT_647140 [Agrocybe pediades]|nr:hypothetical protein CPC08DRAFT_647140 [Agrocybe pediades]